MALQADGNIVERSVHIVGIGERLVRHPEDAEVPRVGQHVAWFDLEYVFGRERDADNFKLFPAPVDDGINTVADIEPIGFNKCLTAEDLVVAPDSQLAPTAEIELVERGFTSYWEGNQLAN